MHMVYLPVFSYLVARNFADFFDWSMSAILYCSLG